MKKHLLTLTCMLLISSLLMAGLGAYLKYEVLKPLGLYQDRNIIELPFQLLTDSAMRYTIQAEAEAELAPPTEATEPPTEPSTEPPTEPPTEEATEAATEPTETEPPVTEPVVIQVDESWFDDVLFIGDSRTVGLRDYARLGEAEYFASIGMSVFDVFDVWAEDRPFGTKKLDYVLENRSYGKIIIALGLNDCGEGQELIMEHFQKLIDYVHEKQPEAKIILHGIITVGRRKAQEAWYFGIDNLYQLNEGMKLLADGETVFYMDANEWVADEEGYLPDEWSGDGCHPYATGYKDWSLWILDNVGTLGIP